MAVHGLRAEGSSRPEGWRLRDVRLAGLVEEAGTWVRLTERGRLLGNEVFERLLPDDEEVD